MRGIFLTLLLVIQPFSNLAELPIHKLQREVAELQSQMKEKNSQVQQLQSDNDEMKTEFKGLQSQMKEMQTEFKQLQTENDEIKSEVKGLKSEVNALQTDCGEMKAEVSGLDTELKEVKTNLNETITEINEVRTEVGDVKTKEEDDFKKANTQIGTNKANIDMLGTSIQDNTDAIQDNKGVIQDSRVAIQNNENSIQSNTDAIKRNTDVIQNNANLIENLHLAPIGSIMAWTPRPSNQATKMELPNGWVRCDGSVIPSPSKWAGMNTPNLNGDRRFLRGGNDNSALTFENDMLQDHHHEDEGHSHHDSGHSHTVNPGDGDFLLRLDSGNNYLAYYSGNGMAYKRRSIESYTDYANIQSSYANIGYPSSGSHGDETRPKNMAVVWIMRVY